MVMSSRSLDKAAKQRARRPWGSQLSLQGPEPRGVAGLWPVLRVMGETRFDFWFLISINLNLNRPMWLPQWTAVDGGGDQ